jgi:hypothetical protein
MNRVDARRKHPRAARASDAITRFIHYLLDRAAFRFSSPDVRHATRGLLLGGRGNGLQEHN